MAGPPALPKVQVSLRLCRPRRSSVRAVPVVYLAMAGCLIRPDQMELAGGLNRNGRTTGTARIPSEPPIRRPDGSPIVLFV